MARGDGSLILRGKVWYMRRYDRGREVRASTRTSDKDVARLLLEDFVRTARVRKPQAAPPCGGRCRPSECEDCLEYHAKQFARADKLEGERSRYQSDERFREMRRARARWRSGRRHGSISLADLQTQRPGCWICGGKATVVDHDHRHCAKQYGCSLCVRGALCRRCNAMIGLAKDDPSLLRAAISYLAAGLAARCVITPPSREKPPA